MGVKKIVNYGYYHLWMTPCPAEINHAHWMLYYKPRLRLFLKEHAYKVNFNPVFILIQFSKIRSVACRNFQSQIFWYHFLDEVKDQLCEQT